jgi:hypothetical protein
VFCGHASSSLALRHPVALDSAISLQAPLLPLQPEPLQEPLLQRRGRALRFLALLAFLHPVLTLLRSPLPHPLILHSSHDDALAA